MQKAEKLELQTASSTFHSCGLNDNAVHLTYLYNSYSDCHHVCMDY